MKNLTWITFLILLQLSLSLPAQTPSPERVMFEPSIRKIPVSGAQTGGSLSPTVVRPTLTQAETQAPLSFSIPLKMHNLAELQKRISTGEIISAAEMTAKYYPTAADYKLVAAFLTSQGFTVKPANRSFNLSVFASGSVTQIQRAFATSFSRVAFAGVEASSAVTAPSLPAAVAGPALGINGLQPALRPRLHSTITPQHPQALIDNLPPYTVPEIANAYNASNLSVNGSGQTIAIVIDTFPASSDLTSFWEGNGVAQ
jgi:kumamolisin